MAKEIGGVVLATFVETKKAVGWTFPARLNAKLKFLENRMSIINVRKVRSKSYLCSPTARRSAQKAIRSSCGECLSNVSQALNDKIVTE